MTIKRHLQRSALTSGPGVLWVTFFLILPILGIGAISFLSRGNYGEVEFPFTLENYQRFMGFGLLGFDLLYPTIVVRSLLLGAATALLCILAGVPLAFFLAALPLRYRHVSLMLVIIPFWTNLLIRTYAWQILMAADGVLGRLAAALGLIEAGQPLFPSLFAVFIGMLCDYLPFMVLPLYASVEKLDWSLADAAKDLGAGRVRVFWHAILPQIVPGLAAGLILVFIPSTGQFVIPDILGGSKTVMVGNVIAQQFGPSRDWPFGSAVAFLCMALAMLGLWLYGKLSGDKGQEALL